MQGLLVTDSSATACDVLNKCAITCYMYRVYKTAVCSPSRYSVALCSKRICDLHDARSGQHRLPKLVTGWPFDLTFVTQLFLCAVSVIYMYIVLLLTPCMIVTNTRTLH